MKSIQIILLLFLQFPILSRVTGQIENINFRRISPPGGFTLKAIYTINKDSLGYVWMGTRQGLIRYHSTNTTWFVPELKDSFSLPNQIVNCVKTDRNNDVWVCTNGGLCKYNRELQNFEPIRYLYENGTSPSNFVSSIIEDNNRMLIMNASYVGYLDLKNKKLERIGLNEIRNPSHIYKDNFDRVWVGTDQGEIYLINDSRNQADKIVEAHGSGVNSIYAEKGEIWVGYDAHGASKYFVNGEFIKQYTFPETPNRKTKNTQVRSIIKDGNGLLWIGAYEGLFLHDGKKMVHFDQVKNPGLPHSSVFEIYKDKEGSLWMGTWAGGVSLVHHSDNTFKTFRHQELINSVNNNMISSFLQLNENELLIGTEGGGLNKLNLKTEQFSRLMISDSTDVENIKSMCKDKYGGIWIGTYRQGVWYSSKNLSGFKQFQSENVDNRILTSARIYALHATRSGVWLGSYGKGIIFYNFNSKTFTSLADSIETNVSIDNLHVNCLFVDSKPNLWIGSSEGLMRVNLKTEKVEDFRQHGIIQQNDLVVYSFWEDKLGKIWIGTKNNGIFIFNQDSVSFEKFNANGLLEDKDVYGFIEDENKNLWITSNNGLILHNPKKNKNRHFVYSDGIQSNLFNPEAVLKDNKENLYFGGTNGFTRVEPSNIKTNTTKPLTTIHQLLTKDNSAAYPNYLNKKEIEPIYLKPTENTFRISFSADNYLTPEKNRYKYRLKNHYDQWIDNQSGSVFFTDIDAGDYIFEVKASNNDGIWNENPTKLHITIQQYWYKTTLAYLFYFLVFGAIAYFIYRIFFERLKLKRAVLLEKTQREKEEQIHEMKLKFFTNISHEFRTPLTLISWPLKRLSNAKNLTEEQKEELEIATRNSSRLLQLINQLINLRKLEKGKSQLMLTKFDLVNFVNEMHKGFSGEDKSKEIQFKVKSEFTSFEIEADREKLDIILYNLLSNAYKYSHKKGEISVKIGKRTNKKANDYNNQLSFGKLETDDFVEIAVEDSGSGIDSEDLLHIFNRFEQGGKNGNGQWNINGSGIGLSLCKDYTLLHNGVIKAQSKVGQGSCFTIQLPQKQKAQAILFESHQEFKNLKEQSTERLKPINGKKIKNQSQILVVEDNNDFRRIIIDYLKQYYRVEDAHNGEEALIKLKHKSIDLVVSDVMMPKMDGFEFCSMVKTQVETSHIPVILLTALSTSDNLIAGLDKGADAYLTKPFDENVLLKQIENILGQRLRIRENFKQKFISRKTIEVGSLDNFFLNRVRSVVEKNIMNDNFSMESLAEELMLSRSQLHRKIKSISGATTSEFVNLVRIKKAIELIKNGNYRFNEVAYKVGFSSQPYFNKCFKKVYGVTPREYFSKKTRAN